MSVIPALMPHRQSIYDLAVGLPLGHELIHQGHEARVVRRFEQVDHLVNDDVFEAFPRLPGEVGIQSDRARTVIAATPFRLHSLDEEPTHPDPYQPLPFFNQWKNRLPELLTMPFFNDCLPLRFVRAPAHMKDHPPMT